MIRVRLYRRKGHIIGFNCAGHSGYDVAGRDIVCAGVSALVITISNSIVEHCAPHVRVRCVDGLIRLRLSRVSHDSDLLMSTMLTGLVEIRSVYGSEYISIRIQEV